MVDIHPFCGTKRFVLADTCLANPVHGQAIWQVMRQVMPAAPWDAGLAAVICDYSFSCN